MSIGPTLVGLGAMEGKDDEFGAGGKGDDARCDGHNWGSSLGLRIFDLIAGTGPILQLRYHHILLIFFHVWTVARWDLRTTITSAFQQIVCKNGRIKPVRNRL